MPRGPTVVFPDLQIHGHALQPDRYVKDDEVGLKGARFKGHEVFATLNTGERVMLILHESGLDAYNRAIEAKHAEAQALQAAEKRLAETTTTGVKEGQG